MAGVAARRKCDALILEGKVFVNNQKIQTLGYQIDEKKDKVFFGLFMH